MDVVPPNLLSMMFSLQLDELGLHKAKCDLTVWSERASFQITAVGQRRSRCPAITEHLRRDHGSSARVLDLVNATEIGFQFC